MRQEQAPFTVSPGSDADAAAAAAVVAAAELRFYGRTTYSRTDLEGEWVTLDVGSDVRVVRNGDRIVGFGTLRNPGDGVVRTEAHIHPDAAGRGVEELLATDLEDEVLRRGVGRIRSSVSEPDDGGRALLESRGYARVRIFREMRITLAGPPAAPRWPSGVTVTPFDAARDAVAFWSADQEAFSEHWGHTKQPFELFAREHLESDRFDPALWCVVREDDAIVAGTICAADTYGGGWVHGLFTRRPWRRRGLGAALLADAFGRFWERGERSIGLGVDADNPTGAFQLYERAGMAPAFGFVVYEKELT